MHVIIAGNGISSLTLIKELNKYSKDLEIEVFTKESRPFYWRPRLIELIANEASIGDITPYDLEWYKKQNVNLHLSESVEKIQPESKTVISSKGTEFKYDALVLANGANPFLLPVEGNNLKNIYTLRTYDDVEALKKHYGQSKRFVIIGGGVLGLEIASALNRAGEKTVSVVEFFPYLLPRQLDKLGAFVLKKKLEEKYHLNFLLGKTTSKIIGNEKVEGIEFSDGSFLEADVIVFSTGVRPAVDISKGTNVKVEKGIVVNDQLETTVSNIYAIGDVAQHRGVIYGIVPPAVEQAKTLAKVLALSSGKYEGSTRANTLKVVGIEVMSVGNIEPTSAKERFSCQGDVEKGIYKKVVIKNERFVGAISIGIEKKEAIKMKNMVDNGEKPHLPIFEYTKLEEG